MNVPCDAGEFVCGWLDCPTHGRPDDGAPVRDPCTPDVGEGWKVSVVRLSEHHFKTVFSCKSRHFILADADDAEEALAHCVHIRDSFRGAIEDVVFAAPPTTRGGIINRRIALGSEIVLLRTRLVELEKTAKKTPPKTLVAERQRVALAKTELAAARELLPRLEAEHAHMRELETSLDIMMPIAASVRVPETDFRALLRRAICDFVEPLILSHLTAGTEWRDAANTFVLECAPLIFGPGESAFGVKPPPVPACAQEPEQADPVHYLIAFGETLCGKGAMTRNITGNPHFVTCRACLAKRERTGLDVRTLEYLGRDFRCATCGKMLRNHVVVSRHEDGSCDETFTGPPLRVYLGEERLHADQGRTSVPGAEPRAAEGHEATQDAQGSARGQGRPGERADEADVPRLRPLTDDSARHCGDDGNGCSAPDACFCSCADCIVARDVARAEAEPLHYACVNCVAPVRSHSMHCGTCLRAFNAGREHERGQRSTS